MGDSDARPAAQDGVFGARVSSDERAMALARHLNSETPPLLDMNWCGDDSHVLTDQPPDDPTRLAAGTPNDHVAEVARSAVAADRYGAFVSVSHPAMETWQTNVRSSGTALTGVPVAVKDNIAVRGMSLTANSEVLHGCVAASDAAIVGRLREVGAWIVGKTALDEFAFATIGSGITNPAAPSRTAGGSSGGSAVAVASGACSLALGTDTGGSVRIPASCTGVVGFKPSSGWYSNQGVIPLSWSLDVIGLLARSVGEVAAAFSAIAGSPAATQELGLRNLRVGVPDQHYLRVAGAAVLEAFTVGCDALRSSVRLIEPVSLPDSDDALDMQYLIVLAEAWEYHRQRWDVATAAYGDGVRSALERGGLISADQYLTAQRARTVLQARLQGLFERYDVLALPTLPIDPPLVGAEEVTLADGRVEDVVSAMLRYTALFNHAGFPAISIPLPSRDGVPRGLQLVGRRNEDGGLLRVATLIEQALAS